MRVAAASPKVKVADCDYNISEIKSMIDEALKEHVQILCFPELSITSYTCADLFSDNFAKKNYLFADKSCRFYAGQTFDRCDCWVAIASEK